mgnify:CR=1 FL=1
MGDLLGLGAAAPADRRARGPDRGEPLEPRRLPAEPNDLGSGDGRIVVTAAKKYGIKAIGFEIDPQRIKESHENIKKAGVENLVEIRQQDIRTVDLSAASVLTMYLLPEVNLMIRPNIWKQMKPGSRVVSHDFDMGDWKPLKTEHMKDGTSWEHTLYLWHVEAGRK